MAKLTKSKIAAILKRIARKASVDPKYRQKALKNPKKVFKDEAGDVEIPASFEVRFYDDQSEAVITLLPPVTGKPNSDYTLLCTTGQKPAAAEINVAAAMSCTTGQRSA